MHVLDDPDGLTPRAQAFLHRAGSRRREVRAVSEHRLVPDRPGRPIGAPPGELTARLDWFGARFGGLRYGVRSRARVGDWSHESVVRWEFDIEGDVRADRTGWSFGWLGQRVSSPVTCRVHADGRFGVSAGGPFLEVSPSIYHMIEEHALLDELFDWEPVAPRALEAWTPGEVGDAYLRSLFDALPPVPEASGPCSRWARSDRFAITLFDVWTHATPRPTGVMMWSPDGQAAGLPGRRW